MSISVIIPAYNEEQYIAHCIESVLANNSDELLEIIVVDNASTDRTAKIAGAFPKVNVVREEVKGLVKARARGAAEAQGAILCYVDADSYVPTDWLSRVSTEFTKADVVCVSGPFFYDSLSSFETILVWLYWYLLAVPISWILGYMATGTNLNIRKTALQHIGGFDTSIAFYGEDTNIARRLNKVGRVRFVPSLIVHTSGRRAEKEGLIGMTIVYVINFLSQVFRGRSRPAEYQDIR